MLTKTLSKFFKFQSIINIMLIATVFSIFAVILLPDEIFTIITSKFNIIVFLCYVELFLALIYALMASFLY